MTTNENTNNANANMNENTENAATTENFSENQNKQNNTSSSNEEIVALAEENAKLKEQLARAQADYQNFVTRTERDKQDMSFFLTEKLLRGLLVQIDHLDRAIKIKDGVEGDGFVDGVRSVQNGLLKYLESNRILPFNSVGEEVDPNRHDVLSQMPGEEGKIIQEFEKGYELDGKVLRHAKVVVGSGE